MNLKDYVTDDRDTFGISARVPVTIVSVRRTVACYLDLSVSDGVGWL